MSDEAALLAAIRANPEEDTPRLAYADWLDEHATTDARRARAEFIRLQIEFAGLSGDDLEPDVIARRKELAAAVAAHEKRYKKEWAADLTGKKGPLRGRDCFFHFRRGFPEKAYAPADRLIAQGDALFRAAPILTLDAKEVTPENLGPLLACPWLVNVRALTLSGRSTNSERTNWEALAECPHLRNLKYVWLSSGQFTRGAARLAAANPFPQLREFMASNVVCGDAGAEGLFGGPVFGQLEQVYCNSCGINTAAVEVMAQSPALAGLKKLSLPSQPLAPDAVRALTSGRYWPELRELVLYGCGLEEPAAEALAASGPTQLRLLTISMNSLGPAAVAVLARSRILETVEHLDLGMNPVGDAGVQALVRSPYIGNLRRLHLGSSVLGPASAKALAACPLLAGLRWLSLYSNAIQAEGALALADSPHMSRLEHLSLSHIRGKARTRLKERFGDRVRF